MIINTPYQRGLFDGFMLGAFVLIMLGALVLPSKANALEVCWQAPTENVDGTPITDTPLDHSIHWGTVSNVYDLPRIDTGEPGDGCYEWTPDPGTYYIRVTAIDASGDRSAYSDDEIAKTQVDTVPPAAPVLLEEERTVFTVIKQPDRFILLPIGVVPAGTECDPQNSINGHLVVPNEDVLWTSPTGSRPIVVVADCS